VDSNVLVAVTDTARAVYGDSKAFLGACVEGKYRAFASGQVFREYAVVVTRPKGVNGLGIPPKQAASNIRAFLKVVQVLEETKESLDVLARLIQAHDLKGKRIHDANMVAVMRAHGLKALKTWNPGDFRCFEGIEII
jgi:predicted nucleic acid-binding protein